MNNEYTVILKFIDWYHDLCTGSIQSFVYSYITSFLCFRMKALDACAKENYIPSELFDAMRSTLDFTLLGKTGDQRGPETCKTSTMSYQQTTSAPSHLPVWLLIAL